MCGIAGILNLSGEPVSKQVVERMCSVIRHRGPDDEGFFVDGNVGFGMRRLSIIDLQSGRQPIANEDGSVQVVFNGEIYNFEELREELKRLGHVFSTQADTEVIVHGYEQWGIACVNRFVGMFGFALWDKREALLFLARDPLGIKPLYYALDGTRFLFGSEIKSLLQVAGFSPTLSYRSVREYFTYGLIFAPHSIYEEVKKLLPGEYVVVSGRNGVIKQRYWALNFRGKTNKKETEYIEELKERLSESVKMQMISDVPLGAFLSGGVDSSVVVAFMAAISDRPVKTFTIGFPESTFDESPYAQAVSHHLHTDHHEFVVEPGHLQDVLPKLSWHFDEPFADASAVPTYYLSRMTREHVVVALSGDGGDELFAGYSQYQNERIVQHFRRLPRAFQRDLIGWLMRRLPRKTPFVKWNYLSQWLGKIYSDALLESPSHRFLSKATIIQDTIRSEILEPGLQEQVDPENEIHRLISEWEAEKTCLDPVEWLMALGTATRLPDDMLVKVDRASMAHSLEVRVPFLDHTLVAFAASMPVDLKLRGFTTKYILKKLACRHLPRKLVYRSKKGFNVPINRWFRGDLASFFQDVFWHSSALDHRLFNPRGIEKILQEHRSGAKDHASLLYALTIFVLWHDQFSANFKHPTRSITLETA